MNAEFVVMPASLRHSGQGERTNATDHEREAERLRAGKPFSGVYGWYGETFATRIATSLDEVVAQISDEAGLWQRLGEAVQATAADVEGVEAENAARFRGIGVTP